MITARGQITIVDLNDAKTITLQTARPFVGCDADKNPRDTTDVIVRAILSNLTGNVRWQVSACIGVLDYDDPELFRISGNTLYIDTERLCSLYDSCSIQASIGSYSASLEIGIVCDGEPGENGDSIAINKSESYVKYAKGESGTTRPRSGWQTAIPAYDATKPYIWTHVHTAYSDGNSTDAYSVSRIGVDGKGIQSSEVKYYQSANNISPESIAEASWGAFPTTLVEGNWLYTRTHIVYSDSSTTNSYSVTKIGTGAYYAGVSEYYAAGTSPTTPPDGSMSEGTYASASEIHFGSNWNTDRSQIELDSNAPYLWNQEVSRDSKGIQYVTPPTCIGNFSKGIEFIVESYAISAYSSPNAGGEYPSDITVWSSEQQNAAPTKAKPYQWNETMITYNDETFETFYHVSAVRGADGETPLTIDIDNEMDAIPLDCNRYITEESQKVVNICLYKGNEKQTIIGCTVEFDNQEIPYDVTYDSEHKTATITFSPEYGELMPENVVANIELTCAGGFRNAVFTLVGIPAGGDGADAEIYQLKPNMSAVGFDRDTDGVTLTPTTQAVTVKITKTVGRTTTELSSIPTGYNVYYALGNIASTSSSQYNYGDSIAVPASTSATFLSVALYKGTTLIDRESLPILKSGEKGKTGASAVAVTVSDTNITAHNSSSNQIFDICIRATRGSNPIKYGENFDCSSLAKSSVITEGLRWTYETREDGYIFVYRLALIANAIVNTTIPFTVTVDDVVYNYSLKFITVADGESITGIEGCIVRRSEWEAGKQYRNDSNLSAPAEGQDKRYIDEVCVTTNGNATWKLCRVTHTAINETGTEDTTNKKWSNTTVWEAIDSLTPLRTSFADIAQAFIDYLQANQIVLMDGSTPYGAFGKNASGYPLWFGGTTPANAVVKFKENGDCNLGENFKVEGGNVTANNMKTSKMTATDGKFAGELFASMMRYGWSTAKDNEIINGTVFKCGILPSLTSEDGLVELTYFNPINTRTLTPNITCEEGCGIFKVTDDIRSSSSGITSVNLGYGMCKLYGFNPDNTHTFWLYQKLNEFTSAEITTLHNLAQE